MNKITRILLVISFALGLQACGLLKPQDASLPSWAAHVSYDGRYLNILDVRDWSNDQKGMKVMLRAESSAMTDLRISFRVNWYTEDGQPIQTVLGKWQERVVSPGQTIELVQVSPGPRAADYHFEIIEK
ncbi:DUF1425 domain-containing protein [Zhongshania aliphaticivorans]|uniref:DUF1425 domain-containing protein n=1 Tax=Zhongshania aliphaticivorans TaxID=1470434 RepID=UPI0012E5DD38|nr:DUF1425 domain-containing protein [Zhongshania aliphaticivorans]CAA0117964.1 Uncharacterised protein [Zhongshania aliphaticivorans]